MVLGEFVVRVNDLGSCEAHCASRESLGNKGWGWEGKCNLS